MNRCKVLGKVIPAISPEVTNLMAKGQYQHNQLVEEVSRMLQSEFNKSEQDRSTRDETDQRVLSLQISLDFCLQAVKEFDVLTLKTIIDATTPDLNLLLLISSSKKDQILIREELIYRHGRGLHSRLEDYKAVREALGISDLLDFEAYGVTEEGIAAVLEVTVLDRHRRLTERMDKMFSGIPGFSKNGQDKVPTSEMSRELADLILEQPDRVQDIIEFMRARGTGVRTVDCELLYNFLDKEAARALTSGML